MLGVFGGGGILRNDSDVIKINYIYGVDDKHNGEQNTCLSLCECWEQNTVVVLVPTQVEQCAVAKRNELVDLR